MNLNKQSIKDKIIFIFYINVDGLSKQQARQGLNYFKQYYSLEKDYHDIIQFFLPIKEGETRIEMLNPGGINDNNSQEILDKLEEINDNLLAQCHTSCYHNSILFNYTLSYITTIIIQHIIHFFLCMNLHIS